MKQFISKNKFLLILSIFILAYIIYFSYFTILRYKTFYASYYDLGIMQQTVYNTYKAISTGDWSRFLELTNPINSAQVKRMAIHNDPLLAFFAPFYFIYSGPETLLIIQSAYLAFGAIAVFLISQEVFKRNKYVNFLGLIFAIGYLLYYPMQLSNIFEFHAVTFATSGLLFMYYFWLKKKYFWSYLFFALSLFAKEQIALVTGMFGIFILFQNYKFKILNQFINFKKIKNKAEFKFAISIILLSLFWFIFSVFVIIPYFRGGQHFAAERYSDFGDSPLKIILGIVLNPFNLTKYIFRQETWNYLINLIGPVGFLSLFSPLHFLISLPELAINILSQNGRMRYMIYHYTAVITPFIFISAIYGANNFLNFKLINSILKNISYKAKILIIYILIFTVYYAYWKGPLPFASTKSRNIHPYKYVAKEVTDAPLWSRILMDESLKISTVGQLSPFFVSRRYFYTFSERYKLADYVVVRLNEIYNYPEKNELIPVYEDLIQNPNYKLIYQKPNFEVYKKIKVY